jgi:hypothetical protein
MIRPYFPSNPLGITYEWAITDNAIGYQEVFVIFL